MSPSNYRRIRRSVAAAATLAIGVIIAFTRSGSSLETGGIGAEVEISRLEFGRLIQDLSEPEGYFDTDNFISNETSYLHVVPALVSNVRPGGVYLGVGPDQNFSYIAHHQPSIAIIADIRRQNMLQHLLFKVLIEEADSRYEFLCRLFSRACSALDPHAEFDVMLGAVRNSLPDGGQFRRNLEHIQEVLLEEYLLPLDETDRRKIAYVYAAFFDAGPDIRFSTLGRPSLRYPTYEDLIRAQDAEGKFRNYLSDEMLFGRLQDFQRENRLIPVVGDLAGDDALLATAEYLSERGLEVSVFYTSNVEFYLFGTLDWADYLANVRRFRFADDALFIRSYFPTFGRIHRQNVAGHRPTSLIQPVAGFLADADGRRLRSYWDVVSRHLLPY